MPNFVHHDLRLLNPSFDSPLLDVLTELEHLRRLELSGDTPLAVFFQLKQVFHLLESLASARIEGNHTTLADYLEAPEPQGQDPSDRIREIQNIESAMSYIDEHISRGDALTEHSIREMHQMTVQSLIREGDRTPGAYRSGQISISQSEHLPPEPSFVSAYMKELFDFINNPDPPKYDLMKVALAHHRFAWIHPFGNGNGRVVRLLTYAMLIKYGFKVNGAGRLLNPAAVFCADREKYYRMLSTADSGEDSGLEAWCTYVLSGVKTEMEKINKLVDYSYLSKNILNPAIEYCVDRRTINGVEATVLKIAVEKREVKSSDLSPAMEGLNQQQRTYQVRKLVDSNLLFPARDGARSYVVGIRNKLLLRGVVHSLTKEGFINESL